MLKKVFLIVFIFLNIVFSSFSVSYDDRSIKYISFEIRGAVKEEKTFNVPLGTRIGDVIDDFGLREDSDISSIALNRVIYSNEIIYIPFKNEKRLISINAATIEELMTLPGIGEGIASRIIEYRDENGSFRSLEELKNVKGIGDKKFEKIKEYISL